MEVYVYTLLLYQSTLLCVTVHFCPVDVLSLLVTKKGLVYVNGSTEGEKGGGLWQVSISHGTDQVTCRIVTHWLPALCSVAQKATVLMISGPSGLLKWKSILVI